tara:strand:- start:12805 stop:13479 length:675 start_codon:yes stop_codon:yes gene_type:complete
MQNTYIRLKDCVVKKTTNVVEKYPLLQSLIIKLLWFSTKCVSISQYMLKKGICLTGLDKVILSKLDKIYYVKNGKVSNKYCCDMILVEYIMMENNDLIRYVKRFEVNDSEIVTFDKTITRVSKKNVLGVQIRIQEDENEKENIEQYSVHDVDFYGKVYNIVGNKLFDKNFIEFILEYNYEIELKDRNYVVVFFDNDIKHHTINKNQYLQVNEDTLEICNIENNE